MRPSSTGRGQAWIEQFEIDDKSAAAALIDSIRVASADEVLGGIKEKLEILVTDPAALPCAIFPVLAREDMRPIRSGTQLPPEPIAFVDFDPSQHLDPAPGSEAVMAHVAREVVRGLRGPSVINQQGVNPVTLERLYRERVRTLVFVTDYIGSGKQVVDYVGSWHRNPRIRSWMSFGWVRVVVVAFASTSAGLGRVQGLIRPPEVQIAEIAPSLKDPAAWALARPIFDLCSNYAKRARLQKPSLGFADSGGLFVSALSVPNNLPAILLESAPPRWTALFENRSMAANMARDVGDFVPGRDIAHELELARESRLAARFTEGQVRGRWASHLTVLALLPATVPDLSARTGFSLNRIANIIDELQGLGLADAAGCQTSQGMREVVRARWGRRKVTAGLVGRDGPYYPRLTR